MAVAMEMWSTSVHWHSQSLLFPWQSFLPLLSRILSSFPPPFSSWPLSGCCAHFLGDVIQNHIFIYKQQFSILTSQTPHWSLNVTARSLQDTSTSLSKKKPAEYPTLQPGVSPVVVSIQAKAASLTLSSDLAFFFFLPCLLPRIYFNWSFIWPLYDHQHDTYRPLQSPSSASLSTPLPNSSQIPTHTTKHLQGLFTIYRIKSKVLTIACMLRFGLLLCVITPLG